MAEIIRTENLQYAYPADEGAEPVLALKGVDLTIEQGSFVVVLGHNGSGKSTLAKTLNGVLLPCGGHVYVEGMDTLDEHLLLAIRRTVGMVFQNPDNQIVANVVEEDVAFAPENLGSLNSSWHVSLPDHVFYSPIEYYPNYVWLYRDCFYLSLIHI